jgi:hypothetical protein
VHNLDAKQLSRLKRRSIKLNKCKVKLQDIVGAQRWIEKEYINELVKMTATRRINGTYYYDDITTPIYTQNLGHKDSIVKY